MGQPIKLGPDGRKISAVMVAIGGSGMLFRFLPESLAIVASGLVLIGAAIFLALPRRKRKT
jgi:hypothetical protein